MSTDSSENNLLISAKINSYLINISFYGQKGNIKTEQKRMKQFQHLLKGESSKMFGQFACVARLQ